MARAGVGVNTYWISSRVSLGGEDVLDLDETVDTCEVRVRVRSN